MTFELVRGLRDARIHTATAAGDAVRVREIEAEILNGDTRQADMLIESPRCDLYRPTPTRPRHERYSFRYFLGGSRHSHFIGTALERDRITPTQIAQIGAVVIIHRLKKNLSALGGFAVKKNGVTRCD